MISRLWQNLTLLLQTPRDYLYMYTYSNSQKVRLVPFDPHVRSVSRHLVAKLSQIIPRHKINLIGSTALEISGLGDIDVYIACVPADFPKYLPLLNRFLGLPVKATARYVVWKLHYKNYPTEIVLLDPNLPRYRSQLLLYRLLSKPRNRAAYARLKLQLNGCSSREYTRQRMIFFNRLLRNV